MVLVGNFLFIEASIPTSTPLPKLPNIINTLEVEISQKKNLTLIISAFCIEKITIIVANSIARMVFNFILIILNVFKLKEAALTF